MDLVYPFGRTIRDLRISVTDRCNFRCTYCMPEEGMQWLPRSEVLTFEEIERLARIFVQRFYVDGIRLTGGEPTVRAHLPVLVRKLADLGVDLALALLSGALLATGKFGSALAPEDYAASTRDWWSDACRGAVMLSRAPALVALGLQIVGRRYDDFGVLKIASAYEERRAFDVSWPCVTEPACEASWCKSRML